MSYFFEAAGHPKVVSSDVSLLIAHKESVPANALRSMANS
jgi:hypothetical protein